MKLKLKRNQDQELERSFFKNRKAKEQPLFRERKANSPNKNETPPRIRVSMEDLESGSINLLEKLELSQNEVALNGMERGGNSRCVSVATISPAPEGRRKKKESFKGKVELIKFRCTALEKKLLKIRAKNCGLTLSEYFRRVAFEKKITERLTDEEIEIYQDLVKYHNNFKAIGNMFRKKNPNLAKMVYALAEDIKTHLKKLTP